MQFDDGAVGEGFGELGQKAFGFGPLAVGKQAGERSGGAAGEQDEAGGVLRDPVERELRLQAGVGVEEALGRQPLQVGEAGGVLREEDDRLGGLSGRVRASWQPMIGWMPLPTQYWLNSSAPNRLPVSVMATAGICASRARAGSLSTLIAPSLSE